MTRTPAELAPMMPALLEALGLCGTGLLVMVDVDGRFERRYVNEAAATMMGYTLEEFEQIPPLMTLIPEHRERVSHLSEAFRAGQPLPVALEVLVQHKDGRRIAMEMTLGHVRISDGMAYIAVFRDLGERSELSLFEADRIALVGALCAGFAHEINNPLTSVLLNLRSLRKHLGAHLPDAAQQQAKRCLDDLTTGAERIASNVRALQTLATRSATQEIDLAAVVSSSLRLAAPTLDAHARVVRQIMPVRPVIGEESRLGQAVLAMLLFSSSGFDSESTDNRIVITVEERARAVIVEVTDNGRDLPADEARRAFDPFFRSKTRGAGVGVGLGVARSIAVGLGGEVTLAPREGGGAMITMRLPATG